MAMEPDDDMKRLLLALGGFIHNFTSVEIILREFIMDRVGVSEDMGNAVFYDFRIDKTIAAIGRYYAAKGRPTPKTLWIAISQLRKITDARNDIVHLGIWPAPKDGASVSNARHIRGVQPIREFTVSAKMLADMSADLDIISDVIFSYRISSRPRPVKSWRYTPQKQS
jgi:hypothetical protein